jgi:hypothetical protein
MAGRSDLPPGGYMLHVAVGMIPHVSGYPLAGLALLCWVGAGWAAAEPLLADEDWVPITRDFTVRVWRKEHGLPDNRVLSLLSARDGFLWIGTRRGVVRFDGREFVVAGRSTHQVFTSEECTSLAEDREGRIWVGTTDGMLLLEDEPRRFDLSAVRLPGKLQMPFRTVAGLWSCWR